MRKSPSPVPDSSETVDIMSGKKTKGRLNLDDKALTRHPPKPGQLHSTHSGKKSEQQLQTLVRKERKEERERERERYRKEVAFYVYYVYKLNNKKKIEKNDAHTINKALRREVLAFTTDGIAQSIERAKILAHKTGISPKTVPSKIVYPENIYDVSDLTISR
ncbi:hypothetical protein RFI_25445 [Reticulomyxa filosa]|uniref:Uncharacterized protein n=1 Tax=Reticulomyxa filosa TaxID=46433 RepID=X6MDI8_RETFI|nr:hypothetical protein RFI_25445 [Reticulomyxa filosa]|eukprot:ETO11929.1 hypothetical protein RFI_25445 [Reticulomyxa filosa]